MLFITYTQDVFNTIVYDTKARMHILASVYCEKQNQLNNYLKVIYNPLILQTN